MRPLTAEKQRRRVLLICCTSLFLVSLDVTVVNIALPSIRRELDTSVEHLQWILDGYALALATFLIFFGSLADRVGRVRVFVVGLAVFTAGSLLCSVAPSIELLVVFRVVQGIGGAMLNPVAMSIIRNTFTDPGERARAIGTWGATIGISMGLGPSLGGFLVGSIGWRSIFWINVPVGITAIAVAIRYIPESKAARARRLDPIGQLLVMVGLFALLFAIIGAPSRGWGAPSTIALFGSTVACIASLVAYEARRRDPLIEIRFFRSLPFAGATLIAALVFFSLGGFLLLTTLYLQSVRGLSPLHAGLMLSPMAAMWIVFGPISAKLLARRGSRPSMIVGGCGMLLSALLLTRVSATTPYFELVAIYVTFGFGLAFINPPVTYTAVSGMPADQAGVAAAIASVCRQAGSALGIAVLGAIAIPAAAVIDRTEFVSANRIGWWVIVGCVAVAIVLAFASTTTWARRTAASMAGLLEPSADAAEPTPPLPVTL